MIPFADWAAAIARATMPSSSTPTMATPIRKLEDPRLEPVDGDDIDELVNEQLARGKADRR